MLAPPPPPSDAGFAEPSTAYKQDYPSNEDGTNASRDYGESRKPEEVYDSRHPSKYNVKGGTHYKISRARSKEEANHMPTPVGRVHDNEEQEEVFRAFFGISGWGGLWEYFSFGYDTFGPKL